LLGVCRLSAGRRARSVSLAHFRRLVNNYANGIDMVIFWEHPGT